MSDFPLSDDLKNIPVEIANKIGEKLGEWFYYIADQIQIGSNAFIKEILDFVLYTPDIAGDEIVVTIWNIVRVISFALIGMMFVWEGFKKGISTDVLKTIEFKQMLIRMIYGIVLSVFSLDIIDILIGFNNTLVQTVKDNFVIHFQTEFTKVGFFGTLVTIVILVVQMVIGIKLLLQYWMRIAEIWFMAVVSPIMYTLWINPSWSGYLNQWFSRLSSTIFTTVAWAILIAIYSSLVSMVSYSTILVGYPTLGPIAGMCLSIALLLVMIEVPDFLRGFMVSHQSAVKLAKNNITQAVKTIKNPVTKVGGWIKKRNS
jgi:hypothetical protein